MNRDHMLAGTGGVSATTMLSVVLQHFQKLDPATADAEAGLIVLSFGAILATVQAVLRRNGAPPQNPAA